MRALVLSDSHGDDFNLRWLLERVWSMTGPIDYYLHLGDGARDFERVESFIRMRDANATCIGVRGNCDFYDSEVPDLARPVIAGHRIFMNHGHHYGVKDELSTIDYASHDQGCTVTLFGHTHKQYSEQRETLLLNPGAARDGRCALLTLESGKTPVARLLEF